MTGIRLASVAGAGLLALLALSGCEAQRESPYLPGQPMSAGPQACPRIYNPVCGARGGARRTFPNSCEASASGYGVLHDGECGSGPPGGGYGSGPYGGGSSGGGSYGGGSYGGGGYGDGAYDGGRDPYGPPGGATQSSGQMCPMIYKPVCARNGNETRTFPNACQADNAGYQVLYESECRGEPGANATGNGSGSGGSGSGASSGGDVAGGGGAAGSGQSCSRTFVPVCGRKGSETKTFINSCMAQSKGYSVESQGRCS